MSELVDRILREGFEDYRRFVNPLVSLRAELMQERFATTQVVEGRLVDRAGEVEDFHGTQSFGHRHPAITAALNDYLATDSPNWFPSRVNPYAGSLARRLCERANATGTGGGNRYGNVFFGNSGAGGVEAALKLCRAATGRPRILALQGAYHGCTMGACALMAEGMFRDLFAPHLPAVESLPPNDIDSLRRAFEHGDVGGVIVEPIQLEGGVRALEPAYIDALCSLSEEHCALLVADEVQTGLGRIGRFLASESWPRRPDAVVFGKHLGGGLLPISAMMTTAELFERAYSQHYAAAEAHNTTFGGNAAACVVAHAALDLLSDDVISRVGELGAWFHEALDARLGSVELYEGMRGEGLVVGIGLKRSSHPWLSFEHFGVEGLTDEPTTGVLLCHRLYKRGFYCFVCGHDWSVLRLQPRFNVSRETLERFVEVIGEELEFLAELC